METYKSLLEGKATSDTKEYNWLQEIRRKLTDLSSKASLAKRSKNKMTSHIAKQVENRIDKIRDLIFDYNEKR